MIFLKILNLLEKGKRVVVEIEKGEEKMIYVMVR